MSNLTTAFRAKVVKAGGKEHIIEALDRSRGALRACLGQSTSRDLESFIRSSVARPGFFEKAEFDLTNILPGNNKFTTHAPTKATRSRRGQ